MAELDFRDWDGDKSYTLEQLVRLLQIAKSKYGAKAVIRFDAGHNNVSVMVTPSKRVKPADLNS